MSSLRGEGRWRWLALLTWAAAATSLWAQAPNRERFFEDPQWFKLRLGQTSTGVYADGEYNTASYRNSSQTVSSERLFVGPLVGLAFDGSIFHPYLLRYQADMEGAFGWNQETTTSANRTSNSSGMDYIGRFNGSADLFSNKPLSANLFGSYGRTLRQYDFFNQVEVNTLNYGAKTLFHQGNLTLNAYYTHTDEEVLDTFLGSTLHQDTAGFGAHDERHSGSTDFRYTLSRYDFSQPGATTSLGTETDHAFALNDTEVFGSRDQARLQSRVSYDLREAEVQPSQQLDASADLTLEHTHHLSSSYNLAYDRYWSAGFASENYLANAQVNHQLYENLHSAVNIQGVDSEISAPGSSGYTRRFGGGFSETYTRHLGLDHTLRLSESLQLGHVQQKGVSTVVNELHTFTGGGGAPADSFFLNLPDVIQSSIVVFDAKRIRTFSPVIDYEVIQNGNRTLISLRAGNTIPPGIAVSVDYQALPTPAGEYDDLSDAAMLRFDLWRGLWGLYARVGLTLNNAPPELHALNMSSYSFGTDFHWHKLSLGAEYTLYYSDESDYKSTRFFQSYYFNPDDVSSAGITLSEVFTDFTSAQRQEDDYRLMSFYRRNLARNLRFNIEAGVDFRRGQGVDQTLAAVRPSLDYIIGKTTVGLLYDYEYSLFLNNEVRNKHLFTLRLRRVF